MRYILSLCPLCSEERIFIICRITWNLGFDSRDFSSIAGHRPGPRSRPAAARRARLAFCRMMALLDAAILAVGGQAGKADFQQAFPLKEGPEKRLCFLKPLFAADTGLL